ncbi:TlpA family protein disulfide reductase [Sphingobacterium corticibacter]|uniref:Thioredoxin domain-containing protein n=1 Tax=Sphingobacterium corticibacter TaxID=2171749 RepID=A0A2T8HND6_9SPHI|nr:TlpA disulfide reductase family protein [Sphingobacterium corticibacter]PVH26946.1 hypothetical protein DC487_04955 [Sphingobacterium corticibacter]
MLRDIKKHLSFVLFFTVMSQLLYGQDTVSVKIKLVNVDRDKLMIHYNDGIMLDFIEDQAIDSIITLTKPNNTIFPRLDIGYAGTEFYVKYSVNNAISSLTIYGNDSESTIRIGDIFNLTSLLDTASNEIYRNLQNGQMAESKLLGELYPKYNNGGRDNDSIKNEFSHIVKQMNRKSIDFLRPYSHNFFSFFYFSDQIMGLSDLIEVDAQYYGELLTYFESTFPNEFKETLEGQKIATILGQKASGYKLGENQFFPDLDIKDIHGNAIPLNDFNEDFLLIDFWASWCGPCLRQLPQVKVLRGEFSEDHLKILSISIDRDSLAFTNARLKHDMNWAHVLDKGDMFGSRLGVGSIPTVVILDRNRQIVYYHNGGMLDLDRIRTILRAKDVAFNAQVE